MKKGVDVVQAARADAQRNRELLVAAAREAFAARGTDASLRDVARSAGVGIGTLYRHFPTRGALLEALVESNFEELRARADELLDSPRPPQDALGEWLTELAAGARTYAGLPQSIMAALADENSQLHASCAAMRAACARLLGRAQKAGTVRSGVTAGEVIALAVGLAWAAQQPGAPTNSMARLLSTAMHGLAIPV
jgi:AcrR family transcriptional regulator